MDSERIEPLSYAERWSRDGLKAVEPPGGFLTLEVDMSEAALARGKAKEAGNAITYTHLIICAVAGALTKNPDLHRLTAGNKRLLPASVDICLSVAGEGAVTPVLILKDAGSKNAEAIAREVRERAAEARSEDENRLRLLNRWGWIVPVAFLRTALIRFFLSRLWYRRMASGTFQVSVVSSVDFFVPFLFNTAAALGAGRVRNRVIAIGGKVEVRPTVMLSCCFDHKVWNGMNAAKFLNAVGAELEASG
jgi:pyruvate dehydrogenase E2 component (dihydrolipoamide acetyltransferase)